MLFDTGIANTGPMGVPYWITTMTPSHTLQHAIVPGCYGILRLQADTCHAAAPPSDKTRAASRPPDRR
jgi:hypothetical protein